MNDSENRKSTAELPDEALENVAGGVRDRMAGRGGSSFKCQGCHDSEKPTKLYGNALYCDASARDRKLL